MGRKRSEPNEQPEPVEGAAEETIADEATPDAAAADETSETADAAVDEVQPEAESAPAEEAAEPVEAAADEQAAAEAPSEAEDEAVAEVPGAVEEPKAKPARKTPARKASKPKAEKKPKPRRAPRSGERKPIVRLPRPERPRGKQKERQGIVVSSAMDKTIVVRVDSARPDRTYKKVVRRSRKFHAHDERNEAGVGDLVRIVETRPLSKTKSWRLAEILEAAK